MKTIQISESELTNQVKGFMTSLSSLATINDTLGFREISNNLRTYCESHPEDEFAHTILRECDDIYRGYIHFSDQWAECIYVSGKRVKLSKYIDHRWKTFNKAIKYSK